MEVKLPTPELRRALANTIANGDFVDTTYHVYSTRLGSGKVGGLRVIYGSSVVLRATEYFQRQLSEEFSTTQVDVPSTSDDYDYYSDSDLEDEEEPNEPSSGESVGEMPSTNSTQSENDKGKESAEAAAMSSVSSPLRTKYSIAVTDCAATTWQALIFYIYTGEVGFAPLRSQGEDIRREAMKDHADTKPGLPKLSSPKSMYRLADKYGFEELKKRAQEDIRSKLTPFRVLNEVFSKFSSRYAEILQAQLDFLNISGLASAEFTPLLEHKLREIIHPDHAHALNTLRYLIQNTGGQPSTPPSTPLASAHREVRRMPAARRSRW